MQNLRLKEKKEENQALYFIEKIRLCRVQTWRKFDRLYFHAKSKIKSTKYHKIKFETSLKSYGYAEYKIGHPDKGTSIVSLTAATDMFPNADDLFSNCTENPSQYN